MSPPKSKRIEVPEPEEEPKVIEVTTEVAEEVKEEIMETLQSDDAPTVVEVPKEAPVTNVHHNMDVVDIEIVDIVSAQRGKRAVPSLIKFRTFSNNIRYVIVDVNDSVVKEAWAAYKAKHGNGANAEVFMAMMYKILDVEVPRMHRAVAPVDLD